MMKKVLVTGGLGFIGSNFILYMLEKYPDYKITNLDLETYAGNPENLKSIENHPDYKLEVGDIRNQNLAERLMEECDYVINFAAESHVDRSISGPLKFTLVNTYGTHVLLEAARQKRIKKFLQIGTDEVYGSLKPKQKSSKETGKLKPNSPYSSSKANADLLARAYYKTYKLPVVITRSSNNYGPRQYPEKLIPLFVTNILEGKKVPLMGDGSNIRDWIYVMDNCEGIDAVLHNGKIGQVYNIGGENEKTNREITNTILNYFGKDESWIETIPHRPGHDFRYSLDCSKTKKLGWQPKTSFEEGIKKTIQWYVENEGWWKKLKAKDPSRPSSNIGKT